MSFPATRLRRLRQNAVIRSLVQEHAIRAEQLVLPVFVVPGQNIEEPVEGFFDVKRRSVDKLMAVCDEALTAGVQTLALFPVLDASVKDLKGHEALNPEGLVPQVAQTIKSNFPELMLVADVALDPYTSHGQDGIIDDKGKILNDETVAVLAKQALISAQSGIDVVAPSDMMDGRVGVIRETLESNGCTDTIILSYAAKYCSAFYGPFREAVKSKACLAKADKKTYQMDPANTAEALREIQSDIEEGADCVMVKPGLPYLDIITQAKAAFDVPIFAYQVSGEYAMLKAAAQARAIDYEQGLMESLLALKRAGASGIFTYAALEAAALLR
ncbi:MAG: porphobilinogen synthase [Legionellales bacterium]|nr:porphobilinogen synthase [Legionellales bacterium]